MNAIYLGVKVVEPSEARFTSTSSISVDKLEIDLGTLFDGEGVPETANQETQVNPPQDDMTGPTAQQECEDHYTSMPSRFRQNRSCIDKQLALPEVGVTH
eukprot:4200634-Amphidinium_carterae.3